MSNPKPAVNIVLSPGACVLLAELAERATAPGAKAASLAELYAAAKRAKAEALAITGESAQDE